MDTRISFPKCPFKRIFYALAGTRAAAVNTVCIKRERQAYAKPARSSLAVYAVNAATCGKRKIICSICECKSTRLRFFDKLSEPAHKIHTAKTAILTAASNAAAYIASANTAYSFSAASVRLTKAVTIAPLYVRQTARSYE